MRSRADRVARVPPKPIIPSTGMHGSDAISAPAPGLRLAISDTNGALDAKIAELGRVRALVRRLAWKCGSGSEGPCPILTAFDMDR